MKVVLSLLIMCAAPLAFAQEQVSLALSFDEWQKLPKAEKEALIGGDTMSTYLNVVRFDAASEAQIKGLANVKAVDFIRLMETNLKAQSSFAIDSYHARIGDPYVIGASVIMVYDQILGGAISYKQDGCDMPTQEANVVFASLDEAKAAGCDVEADVSWESKGTFDFDGNLISATGKMEWTGYPEERP